jgi:hypothetical protein
MNNTKKEVAVDLNNCPTIECACGNPFFEFRIVIKRIPGIMVAQSQDIYHQERILACSKCGKPNANTTALKMDKYFPEGE